MKKRLVRLMFFFLFIFFVILCRLFFLQVFGGLGGGLGKNHLVEKAINLHSQTMAAEEYFRGEILDRHLRSLTDSGMRPTLVAFPGSIADIKSTCTRLETIICFSAEQLLHEISRSKGHFGSNNPVVLKANLTSEEIGLISKAGLAGIAVMPVKTRYGPRSLARHLVGYLNRISPREWEKLSSEKKTVETSGFLPTSYRLTDKIGVAGLEKKYEEILRGAGAENNIRGIVDAHGQLLEGLGYRIKREEADRWRNHLILTIDYHYQEIVEKIMDQEIARGAVAVIDIDSGDVLAVASRPNYNQNNLGEYLTGYDELVDRSERMAFYPGSVFKTVVAAAALEEKLVKMAEEFVCPGFYRFPDQTQIGCGQEHGIVNVKEAFRISCNTAFINLGLRLGSEKLVQYAAKLGFAVKFVHPTPPALLANASIGQQGVLVSPLQIANLYATIGRNGLFRPYRIVAEIRNYQGDVIQDFPPSYGEQILAPSTCAVLKECLTACVREGTGNQAWIEGRGVAGKTGTAQANKNGRVIAWFAGFTPLDNPSLAIAVMVEEKSSGDFKGLRGGEEAAPVFRKIVEEIVKIGNNKQN